MLDRDELLDRQFRTSFEEAAVGLAHVAPDGRWLRVNAQCSAITGYTRDELLGGSFQQITHPDDLAQDLAQVTTLLEGGASRYAMEKRYIRKDGELVWVNLTVTLVRDAAGQPEYFVAVIEDISERKRVATSLAENESRYRAIFDSAVEAIAVIDVVGSIQSVNPAVERIFGYKPEQLIGENVRVLMPPAVAGEHDGYLSRYSETGERAIIGVGREVEGQRKDGTLVALDLSVAEWQHGGQTFFIGIMRDLSPHRAAEMALRASEEQLRSLQNEYAHLARVNELSEMAAAISHEINQPLTAIVNYLNAGLYATAEGLNPDTFAEAREVMSEAAAQALRAGDVVRRLREFIGRGSEERRVEKIDTLVDAASGFALIDARANGIAVERVANAGGALVFVDHVQIQQVVVNMVRNAIDALLTLPPGRERLLTIATSIVAEQSAVEIRIVDTGPGVAADMRTSLFEPFVTTKAYGIGMGLSVCRRLVEAHGGTIKLEENGAGASFCLRLPQVVAE